MRHIHSALIACLLVNAYTATPYTSTIRILDNIDQTCSPGFYYSTGSICKPCVINCHTCDSSSSCTRCQAGYIIDTVGSTSTCVYDSIDKANRTSTAVGVLIAAIFATICSCVLCCTVIGVVSYCMHRRNSKGRVVALRNEAILGQNPTNIQIVGYPPQTQNYNPNIAMSMQGVPQAFWNVPPHEVNPQGHMYLQHAYMPSNLDNQPPPMLTIIANQREET